ncbi:type II CAAX prenyl endopeptidase Rce1 family protein [Mycetocola zhadangensis]|jgi:membrane protease YdiL (CAAX protease family)|uniref:CPBP family glutamic-type intramembrane protease n=1 Tax=Mycetocola zhadangensis TaxID=1164595 RepID=UPI003A4D4E73
MTLTPPVTSTDSRAVLSWKLLPGLLLAASGFLLFGLDQRPVGYATLAATLAAAVLIDRPLAKDLLLITIGLVAISLVPINTDIEWGHMLLMGTALVAAVLVPYLVSRFIYRDHAIRFPVWTGNRWTRFEFGYLIAVVILGWFLLPVYMIPTGVYQNWPAASDPGSIARLFLGTNALGIWDELFFICTTFTLLRRHFPDWQANLLQAVLFTSFLWELGFHSWGPFLIYPFAVLQGFIFRQTKSLSYIVSVHLLFDFILFLVLLHAHNRDWLAIFLY